VTLWELSVVKPTTIHCLRSASIYQFGHAYILGSCSLLASLSQLTCSVKPRPGSCNRRRTTCIQPHICCVYPSLAVNCTVDTAEAKRKHPLLPHRPHTTPSPQSRHSSRLHPSAHCIPAARATGHCCSHRRRGAATRRVGTSGDQGLSHTADRGASSQVPRSCFSTAHPNA
jgi:hypothetical protein